MKKKEMEYERNEMMNNQATYKPSMYNYIVENNEDVIIFNTLTKKLRIMCRDEFVSMMEYMQNCSSATLDELVKQGFLVDSMVDERAYAEVLHLKKIFSNDTLELTIIPTDECNFSCVYCFEDERDHHMTIDTANAIIKYLEKNARYYKSVCINWFGGEPTIEKELVVYIMKAAKEICLRDKVTLIGFMTTNGYELDLETFERFVKYNIRFYQITIDGTEQCHNKLRPHKNASNSFERIIDNLVCISQKMKTGSLAFNIGVRFNVSVSNIDDIKCLLNQYIDLFINDKRFSVIWQWVRDWGGVRINEKLVETSGDAEIACRQLYNETINRKIQCVELLSCNSGREFCEAGRKNAYVINYNGDVLKCAMAIYNQDINVVNKNHIGCITPNGIMKVDQWKESLWLQLPQRAEKCNECKHYPMCMNGCCPLSSKINDHSRCFSYKLFIREQIINYSNIMQRRRPYA